MGYWQKESEFWKKKVGCFKASLGSLGLKKISVFLNFGTNLLQRVAKSVQLEQETILTQFLLWSRQIWNPG